MTTSKDSSGPVNAKAILLDPESMTVLWMNEAAAEEAGIAEGATGQGLPLTDAMPMADTLGVLGAIPAVASSGTPTHCRTNLVSTHQGSMAIATSIYRLPDGAVLILTEHAWQPDHSRSESSGGQSRPRRHRR